MEREQILDVIQKHLIKSVDEISDSKIDPQKTLVDYGASSLDIVELISGSMRELKIKIPRAELNNIDNIAGLVDIFEKYAVKTEEKVNA